MIKPLFTKTLTRVLATIALGVALAVGAGATASSAEAASCFGKDGVHYCYQGRQWSGNAFYADVYSTYVYVNGVSGTLYRMVSWNGWSWQLYGCYRVIPGFSGYVACPF